jgi:hypothetical protein
VTDSSTAGGKYAHTLPARDDRLRPLWDFDDLDATEARMRRQLVDEPTEAGQARY